jgi:hypothetical protein
VNSSVSSSDVKKAHDLGVAAHAAGKKVSISGSADKYRAAVAEMRKWEKKFIKELDGKAVVGSIFVKTPYHLVQKELLGMGLVRRKSSPGSLLFSKKDVMVRAKPVGRTAPKRLKQYSTEISLFVNEKVKPAMTASTELSAASTPKNSLHGAVAKWLAALAKQVAGVIPPKFEVKEASPSSDGLFYYLIAKGYDAADMPVTITVRLSYNPRNAAAPVDIKLEQDSFLRASKQSFDLRGSDNPKAVLRDIAKWMQAQV